MSRGAATEVKTEGVKEVNVRRLLYFTGVVVALGLMLAVAAVMATSNTPVHASSHPDLIVIGIDASDSVETGGSFRVGVTVTNQGDGRSASTTLRWKHSSDSNITTSDTTVGTDDVRSLVNPQGSFESIRLTAPSNPGTYYYGACVDSVAGETDTTNNCSSAVGVPVTQVPPVTASSTDATLSALTLSNVNFGTFSPGTTSYSASVANSVTQTTVSPTVNHSGASYVVKLGGSVDSDRVIPLSVGRNVITVEVTAEDGQTNRTYTATVTRAAPVPASSTDATLSALRLSSINFGRFSPNTTSYSASVANSVTQTTVTPTVNHSAASYVIRLAGVTDADGTVSLAVGRNVIAVVVTAEDGQTIRTYTVTVTRAAPPSTDATLRTIALSGIDIGDGLGEATSARTQTSFAASVYHSVSQTTVTPTVNHSGASYVIKLGGVTDADGTVSLAVGSNVITIEVTSQDGQTTGTYTVTVGRANSSAPTTGELSTDDPRVNFHTVQYSQSSVTLSVSFPRNRGITGVVTQRYKHDGSSFVSAGADGRYEETVDDDLGGLTLTWSFTEVESDTRYRWVVTMLNSQNATVIQTSLEVIILPAAGSTATSTDATLSNLTLSGIEIEAEDRTFVGSGFHSNVTNYVGSAASSVTETTITPTVNHSGASYVIKVGGVTDADGTVSLSVGSNIITIDVTAEDGQTTRTYTVTVTRAEPPSTDATLSGLLLSAIDFGTFSSSTLSYTADVTNTPTRTTVTPTVNHTGASYAIKLAGSIDVDGVILLSAGSNVITIEVTAEDGSTIRTYTVTVTLLVTSQQVSASSDAMLRALTLSDVDFGTFDSTTLSYRAVGSNNVAQTTVTPTVNQSDATYTIKLNGAEGSDGVVDLSVGRNTITVGVTAEDGSTIQTYTVAVIREGRLPLSIGLSSSGPITQGESATATLSFAGLTAESLSNLTYRADVFDSVGTGADSCEGSGMGSNQTMAVVDEDPEVRSVSISADCPLGAYTVEVALTSSSNETLAYGSSSFSVASAQEMLEDRMMDRYDDDRNGAIDGNEVLEAVRDYFDGILTGEEILTLVRLYFSG